MNNIAESKTSISNIRIKETTKNVFDEHLNMMNSKIVDNRKIGKKITYDDVILNLLNFIDDSFVVRMQKRSLTPDDMHFLLQRRYKEAHPDSNTQDFKNIQLQPEKWSKFLAENKDVLEAF